MKKLPQIKYILNYQANNTFYQPSLFNFMLKVPSNEYCTDFLSSFKNLILNKGFHVLKKIYT